MAYTIVLPALTPEERERYYAESRLFASLFGIPQASLPEGWAPSPRIPKQWRNPTH
jgi:uncharacterized protein (DUF2236 family)